MPEVPCLPAIMKQHSTIATKFLVISDTHNFEFGNNDGDTHPLREPTPKVDVLLHCGDLTEVGGISSYEKALRMLGRIDAELKLVIPGNHDLDLDKQFWEAHDDDQEDHNAAVNTMTGRLADEAGVSYLAEGTHSFTLKSGAKFTIYVSPYTPAFFDWAFAYERNEDRYNGPQEVAGAITSIATEPMPNGVDIVMTHGPPRGILDSCPGESVGCDNLLRALRRVKPTMHCFGHIHECNGVEVIEWQKLAIGPSLQPDLDAVQKYFKNDPIENPYPAPYVWKYGHGERTLAVNAAIMTVRYKPENKPWVINLDLPRSS
ncbi:hypothetical protein MMC34_005590 [Xylographa carneopallida]|nr:hypothetical protein [Xylographa carneopallida]